MNVLSNNTTTRDISDCVCRPQQPATTTTTIFLSIFKKRLICICLKKKEKIRHKTDCEVDCNQIRIG